MSQHPPSQMDRPGPVNYLLRHWRGELPLPQSVFGNGLLVWLGLFVAIALLRPRYPFSGDDWAIPRAILTALSYPVAIWQLVGISRSALRYQRSGGDTRWATLAQIVVIVASFAIFVGVVSYLV